VQLICLFTSMIVDQIGRHDDPLPTNNIYNKVPGGKSFRRKKKHLYLQHTWKIELVQAQLTPYNPCACAYYPVTPINWTPLILLPFWVMRTMWKGISHWKATFVSRKQWSIFESNFTGWAQILLSKAFPSLTCLEEVMFPQQCFQN